MAAGFDIRDNVLIKYTGTDTDIEIPEGVVKINERVFEDNKRLTSVVMPDSVLSIGTHAFEKCLKLKTVKFSVNLKEIGFYCFCGCKALTEIELPETLEEIGAYAFKNCDLLESIIIPDTVKKIGTGAFKGCDHLVSVTMPENVDEGDGIFSGCRGLADENGFIIQNNVIHSFYGGEAEIVVPEGIKAIASGVFSKSRITSIQLSSSLEKLGAAFSECWFLTEIVIPEGIEEIQPGTFNNCVNLKNVSLPSTLKKIGYGVFSGCELLEEIVIPEGVEKIGEAAFEKCSSLKSISVPSSVKELRRGIFDACTALKKVDLCEGLKEIHEMVFRKCKSLQEIIIPETIEKIGEDAFTNCTSLKKVICKSNNIAFHPDAFDNCSALVDENGMIIVAGILWKYEGAGGEVTVPEGVVKIGPNAFSEGSSRAWRSYTSYRKPGSLTAVSFPSTLKTIYKNAFDGCISLKEITLPQGLSTIGEEAFRGCNSLQQINNTESLIEIGPRAFYDCNNLKEFLIPDGIKEIAPETFYGCSALKCIEIPAGLDSIGMDAFRGCHSLSVISVNEKNSQFSSKDGMLLNKSGDELITCPPGKQLGEYTIPSKIKSIWAHAFISCKKLKKIVVPATVESIGDEAFPRGKTLKEIEVEPGAGKVIVGVEVFDIFKENTPLVYPKLPVTFIKEQKTQVCLGLGFCMNPDKYKGEYAELYQKYAKSHEKTLTRKADSLSLVSVAKYFSAIPASETAEKKEGTINYKKLSPKAKIDMLESAVLENDIEKAKTVIEDCGEFEFTPRALGLACLYSDVEMVKLLVENGATFKYKYDPSLKRKYGAAYATKYSPYPVNYSELIARTDIDVYNPMICASTHDYHFGTLPKISAKENTEEVRADIAEYLVSEKKAEFDSIAALFYAILWGSTEVAQRLMEKGVTLPSQYLSDLYNTGSSISRKEVLVTLPRLSEKKCIYAIKSFVHLLEGTGKQMILTQRVFDANPGGKNAMLNAGVLECLFAETDTSKINKSKVLEMVIDTDDVKALKAVMDTGVIKTTTQRDKTIAYATKNKKNDVLAWLMDYKNRTADVAAEAAEEEKKMIRELTENPNSVSALKKKWGYKKLDDGTLVITSYKGSEEVVSVPARIGKSVVTVIGEEAFSTGSYVRSGNQENRNKIKSITIPEGIVTIQKNAFYQCGSLEAITLPSTLKSIGAYAFSGCVKLKKIDIPDKTKIATHAFLECKLMENEKGLIVVNGVLCEYGENVTIISNGVFGKRTSLEEVYIPASVKKIQNEAFCYSGLERVTIAEGVKRIGESAFEGTKITEIRIPSTVTVVGARAFYGCKELKDVYISANTTKIGKDLLGNDDNYSGYSRVTYKPCGIHVHTPYDSAAAEYMKRYSGVFVVNDYDEKELPE